MSILITGGAGYIAGYDNLSKESINKTISFEEGDIRIDSVGSKTT